MVGGLVLKHVSAHVMYSFFFFKRTKQDLMYSTQKKARIPTRLCSYCLGRTPHYYHLALSSCEMADSSCDRKRKVWANKDLCENTEKLEKFMNHPAPANSRYKPTCYEHAANCYTHAFLIFPAIVGSALLHRLSEDQWEKITAWMYGVGLCALFIVSTVFHIISWKKSHLRTMEHCFHMCDRMMIYIFIAASYAPWLNLRELGPLASHMRWFIWLMAAGGAFYVFLYHERNAFPNVRESLPSEYLWAVERERYTLTYLHLLLFSPSANNRN
ncbi:monocyte to macrophage differentiation factor isoform X4 [Candoia aspera]|uniref:monocyte to macrophage differentiation factor isoform X4 n=1 Tax=Candoia aspera TaxID=51853 RepID=UPI002FD81897